MSVMVLRISPDFFNLVGIPYLDLDCWQLAKKFYDQVLGVELKNYYDKTPDTRDEMKNIIYSNRGEFQKVSDPIFGDLILVKLFGIESHIAIYVGRNSMLHTTKSTGSIVDRVDKWQRNIIGFYRLPRKEEKI